MNFYHILSAPSEGTFDHRLAELGAAAERYLHAEQQRGHALCYSKIMCSDLLNQHNDIAQWPLYTDVLRHAACTIVEQAPLNGSKISLLLHTSDQATPYDFLSLRLTTKEAHGLDSYEQTELLFTRYLAHIEQMGLKMGQHLVRTWIYVADIDRHYAGVVNARNYMFALDGLTADTHFIASTGIGGRSASRDALVAIDFLTLPCATSEATQYLKALHMLNPTHEYGVAFERGTRVTLPSGDDDIFISGTASIDHRGHVLHRGDVVSQANRLLDNIAALLADGGATIDDVGYFLVYLRDLSDAPAVEAYMKQRFPATPWVLLLAKVCRPEWLIEMECVAHRHQS